MYQNIIDFFQANEPELVLISYSRGGNVAKFQCLDCDGYRLGYLNFENVRFLCVATQEESFNGINIYSISDIPDEFAWVRTYIPSGYILAVMQSALDEEDSGLPVFSERRAGLILCSGIFFEKERNLGRA